MGVTLSYPPLLPGSLHRSLNHTPLTHLTDLLPWLPTHLPTHSPLPILQALGTEVEVALGKSLVAALSHNMPASASEAGEAGMEVKLSLAITRQLRLLMQQRGLRLAPLVLLQFSSEGIPGAVQQ